MKELVILLLCSYYSIANAQHYETIYNKSTSLKPIASEIDSQGNLWIVGGDPTPFVTKLDSNGNELFFHAFSEFAVTEQKDGFLDDIEFTEDGRIWVTGYHTDPETFVMELDANGNQLQYLEIPEGNWHEERHRLLVSSGNDLYLAANRLPLEGDTDTMCIYRLSVSSQLLSARKIFSTTDHHLTRFVDQPFYDFFGIPTIAIGSAIHLPYNNNRHLKLIGDNVILSEMNAAFPVAAYDGGFIGVMSDKPSWYRHFLVRQDESFGLLDSLEIKRYPSSHSFFNFSMILDLAVSPQYGLIVAAGTRMGSIGKVEILQMNSANFNIVDSVELDVEIKEDGLHDLVVRDSMIYAVQIANGHSSGIKVHRIYLNELAHTTEFYLSDNDVIESVNINSSQVELYPNPIRLGGSFRVNGIDVGSTIQVVDINGKVLLELIAESEHQLVSTLGFSRGIYFVKVEQNEAISVERMVVQ